MRSNAQGPKTKLFPASKRNISMRTKALSFLFPFSSDATSIRDPTVHGHRRHGHDSGMATWGSRGRADVESSARVGGATYGAWKLTWLQWLKHLELRVGIWDWACVVFGLGKIWALHMLCITNL
ncbi:hypothetical protein ES288_A05G394300v1 [Gossypium darwinii]|uniref:Uncharacterized protein n=1 Tax=Gossypium darwinii TaxID=34276 RepID=A0A5D2GPN7_GOSDA|nr:hypothetical protein ES288_A05G394300v1 [Gossypium darwinii]